MGTYFRNAILSYHAVASTPNFQESDHTYLWQFDDGSTAHGRTVIKAWATSGNHSATVTATNQVIGTTAQTTKTVPISDMVVDTDISGLPEGKMILLPSGKILFAAINYYRLIDVKTKTLSTVPNPPIFGSLYVGDLLPLSDGAMMTGNDAYNSSGVGLKCVKYNESSNTWSTLADLPGIGWGWGESSGWLMADGNTYIYSTNMVSYNHTAVYNPITNTWTIGGIGSLRSLIYQDIIQLDDRNLLISEPSNWGGNNVHNIYKFSLDSNVSGELQYSHTEPGTPDPVPVITPCARILTTELMFPNIVTFGPNTVMFCGGSSVYSVINPRYESYLIDLTGVGNCHLPPGGTYPDYDNTSALPIGISKTSLPSGYSMGNPVSIDSDCALFIGIGNSHFAGTKILCYRLSTNSWDDVGDLPINQNTGIWYMNAMTSRKYVIHSRGADWNTLVVHCLANSNSRLLFYDI